MNYDQGKTMIMNMALTQMGLEMIDSPDQLNDSAKVLDLYYPVVLKRLLSEYDWSFARKTLDITEVVPDKQYKNYDHYFQLPEDFLRPLRIRPENDYWEIYDGDTLVCNTVATRTIQVLDPDDYLIIEEEEEDFIELTYIMNDVDPMKMNAAFVQYFAYSLAQDVAFQLTGDRGVVQMILQLANSYQSIAHVEDSSNSRQTPVQEKKPWYLNDRDYYARRYRDGGPNNTEDFYG